jgi:hypothetical protein
MPFVNETRGVAGSRRLESSITSMTPGYSDTATTDDTDTDFTTTGGAADGEWYGRKFTAVNTGKVQYAQLELADTGAPAGWIVAMIYSDDGGSPSVPDAQIGSDSDAITNTTLTASPGTTEEFTWGGDEGQNGDGPNIVSGTAYWLVMKTVGYTYANGVTEVIWRTDANGGVGLNECAKYDSNASPNWTSVGADVGANLVIGSSANFTISTDVSGDPLPNEFRIETVSVKPSVATVYEMSIFSKSTRLRQDTLYVNPWYDGESASQVVALDVQPYRFQNRDYDNTMYCSIRIHPDEADSAFEIALQIT